MCAVGLLVTCHGGNRQNWQKFAFMVNFTPTSVVLGLLVKLAGTLMGVLGLLTRNFGRCTVPPLPLHALCLTLLHKGVYNGSVAPY